MSQAELANRANVSRGYLSRVELGMQSPTLEVIERLAAVLGVRAVGGVGGPRAGKREIYKANPLKVR